MSSPAPARLSSEQRAPLPMVASSFQGLHLRRPTVAFRRLGTLLPANLSQAMYTATRMRVVSSTSRSNSAVRGE
eukprot:5663935-Alexandrium_andersonii.AAC.1